MKFCHICLPYTGRRPFMTNKTATDTEMRAGAKEGMILNSKTADSSSKIIFENNILCSQFLRDYINLPYLRDIQPEDIEDVSDRYVPLFAEERNADRVKKVSIKNENPFFLISLIEHKSTVDYNVSMQIFRYMVYIWEAYEKEAEKLHSGITKRADFRYPPILPIVYYEGSGKWNVPYDFKSRVMEGKVFGKFIPDFEYYLVPLRQYSNEELLAKKDEISLVMMINRMQNRDDIEAFRKLPADEVEEILRETPGYLLDVISNILRTFLLKVKVPVEEAEELVGLIKEKKMGYLFENMEKMDIQAERRNTAQQRERADRAEKEAEKGIQVSIELCQELKVTKQETIRKIVEKFGLSEQEAASRLSLYWKE